MGYTLDVESVYNGILNVLTENELAETCHIPALVAILHEFMKRHEHWKISSDWQLKHVNPLKHEDN